MEKQMDGWVDRRMDGQMDERMDGYLGLRDALGQSFFFLLIFPFIFLSVFLILIFHSFDLYYNNDNTITATVRPSILSDCPSVRI